MLDEIARGLATYKLIPFFGAGVSAAHLGVVWADIANEMAELVHLPNEQRGNFLYVADRFVDELGEGELANLLRKRLIVEQFDDVKGWPHLWMLSLSCGILYTTNQDNLFELAALKKGRPYRVIKAQEDFSDWSPNEPLLVKFHGDLSAPSSVIFSGHSFRKRMAENDNFLNIRMRSDILSKGFLFVGYSFNDPTIKNLFQELKSAFGQTLPPSFLVAYNYDSKLEELHDEFGVKIIDPSAEYPLAKDHDEAFQRYLKSISERVIHLKSERELRDLFTPAVPPTIRVVTTFEIDAVFSAAKNNTLDEAIKTYRSTLDMAAIPEGLEEKALESFALLCESASSKADLQELSGAIFNCTLEPALALQAISKLMVSLNRIVREGSFPEVMIICPDHPDELIPLAAALAVADIKQQGKIVGEGFRSHVSSWMSAYKNLPPDKQEIVRNQMAVAWKDGGQQLPPHILTGLFVQQTFREISANLKASLPKTSNRPLF